jgi:hypothetical protein
MGTLDDAIREHLDLKRSQGASEEELDRAESEALGRGRPAVDSSPEKTAEVPAAVPAKAAADEPTADHQPSMLEELDPDEVLPEEALDPDAFSAEDRRERSLPAVPEEPPAPSVERMPASGERVGDVDDEDALLDDGEDVLEETPDFLEETPEHDRLWFEQKPPRDFDFD